MSYSKQTVYNIKCDGCGATCDEEAWYSDRSELDLCCETAEWIVLGRRHYCPHCYTRDDDDNIVVRDKDGKFGN